MKGHNKGIHIVTFLLVIVGGINWLLVGAFNWDIGSLFGGMNTTISRVIYVLVGLSAVYEIATHKANCKKCSAMMDTSKNKPMDKPSDPVSSSGVSQPM